MRIRLLQFIIGTAILLNACSHSGFFRQREKTPIQDLTQRVIFEYLTSPNILLDQIVGKGAIKLDSNLFERDSLTINGKSFFNDPMHTSGLKPQKHKKRFALNIPDSLVDKYTYTTSELDYEHDYALIFQFSPLLPTRHKNTYFMQQYVWFNMCDEEMCIRALARNFLSFKIIGDDVVFQTDPPFYNQADFIGFGSFSRKKMDEALPGEKIVKFGY